MASHFFKCTCALAAPFYAVKYGKLQSEGDEYFVIKSVIQPNQVRGWATANVAQCLTGAQTRSGQWGMSVGYKGPICGDVSG